MAGGREHHPDRGEPDHERNDGDPRPDQPREIVERIAVALASGAPVEFPDIGSEHRGHGGLLENPMRDSIYGAPPQFKGVRKKDSESQKRRRRA